MSESWQIIFGDFPPNSKVIFFNYPWHELEMIFLPTSVDPVKATLSICLCLTKCAPTSPNPVKMFITPGGKPASLMRDPMKRAERGVCSAGFKMPTQPVARRGPHFQAIMSNGKFQGIIWAQTPTGSYLKYPM